MDLPEGFYGITDERFGCIESAKKLIEFGAKIIQYRCKLKSDREMFYEAKKIREMTKAEGIVFIVDDRVDLALVVEADGVHLGDKDLPACEVRRIVPEGFIIGLSTHSIEDVKNADCCDYIGVGPVFETTTKKNPHPTLGIDLAKEMVKISKYPAFLIGGISLENIHLIKDIKAYGFVSVRDVLANNKEHFERMLKIWQS